MSAWSIAAAPALVACAVLLLPGLLLARLARLRGLVALAVAPALSAGVLGTSAVLAPAAHLAWSWRVVAGGTAVGAVAAVLVGALAGRPRARLRRRPALLRSLPTRRDLVVGAAALGGGGLGGVLALRRLVHALGAPAAISQTYDATFHLNAVRWVLDSGDASSLHLGRMTHPGASVSFYPAVWHALVALVVQLTGTTIPVATNATAIAVAVVVWPTAVVGLARAVVGRRPVALAAAGALTAAFCAQPVVPIAFGVLYPTLLVTSLVPGALALLVRAADAARPGRARWAALVLAAGCVPGLALSQTSGVFAVAALGLPLGGWTLARWTRARWSRPGGGPVALAGAAAAVVATAGVLAAVTASPPVAALRRTDWKAGPVGRAVLEAVDGGYADRPAAWFPAALVLLGAVVAWRRPRWRWLVVAHLVTSTLYVLAWGVDGKVSQLLTGFWYNDGHRIAGLAVVTGLPLASVGAMALARVPQLALHRLTAHRRRAVGGSPVRPPVGAPASPPFGVDLGPFGGGGGSGGGTVAPTGTATALRERSRTLTHAVVPTPRRALRAELAALPALSSTRWALTASALAVVTVGAVLVGAHGAGYARNYALVAQYAANTDDAASSPLITTDVRALITRLPAEVPAGDGVAADPWTGAGLVYALADRRTPFAHLDVRPRDAGEVVAAHLRDAATDPAVCPAVRALGVEYALEVDGHALWVDPAGRERLYPGLSGLGGASGFQLVDSQGGAQLFRITACDPA